MEEMLLAKDHDVIEAVPPDRSDQRLAINGDHIGRRPGQCRDPGDEAALDFLGVLSSSP